MTSTAKGKHLNPFQMALLRPDMFIGSVKTKLTSMFVYNLAMDKTSPFKTSDENSSIENEFENNEDVENVDEDEHKSKKRSVKQSPFIYKEIKFNAGLTCVFTEILSNAIDNKWRSEKTDTPMKKIEITVDVEEGWIHVLNDGLCIPVAKEDYEYEDYKTNTVKVETCYPAELYFGDMFAGTNFENDTTEKKSGRNGVGGKGANTYSKKFRVEHTDPVNHKKFFQEYSNNGKNRTEPKITSYQNKSGYTKISFLPDYKYFDYEGIDEDFYSVLKRLAYDAALVSGLTIIFNDEKIVVKDLQKYVRLYFPDVKKHNLISLGVEDCDCVVVEHDLDLDDDTSKETLQVSFVNGRATTKGGVHVDTWREYLVSRFVKHFNESSTKKDEKRSIKTAAKQIHPYLMIFVKFEVFGAHFTDQDKTYLDDPPPVMRKDKEFKDITQSSLEKMMKWNFVTALKEKLLLKADKGAENSKNKRKLLVDAKFTDANMAGKKNRKQPCTVFITEGLSSKDLPRIYYEKAPNMGGTDYNAVLPIRGKFPNIIGRSLKEIDANKEVKLIKAVFGLNYKVDYSKDENFKTLRYDRVMLMPDQDDDGIHICGLLLVFFYVLWPSLIERKFVQVFSTGVKRLKYKIGKELKNLIFYSTTSFEKWYKEEILENENAAKDYPKYEIQHYKGLGTHTAEDIKLYINDPKIVIFTPSEDPEEDKKMIHIGFDTKFSNEKKKWMFDEKHHEDVDFQCEGEQTPALFVDEKLIIYHKRALLRALPFFMDSLKDSQRKILYGVMTYNKGKIYKVVNITGHIIEATEYHHGETSIHKAIIHLAQTFVGTNNVPLLEQGGNFGSRQGGKDCHVAPRYLFTGKTEFLSILFNELDNPLLIRKIEDGKEIEYEKFLPIVPLVLLNGTCGIASGWATEIPSYNPIEIVDRITEWLDDDTSLDVEEDQDVATLLTPWYRNFKGTINLVSTKLENGKTVYKSWESIGILEQNRKQPKFWNIYELPIGMWMETFKMHLDILETGLTPKRKKNEEPIVSIKPAKDYCNISEDTINYQIEPTDEFIPDMTVSGNFKILRKQHSLNKMVMLDENNIPKKFERAEDILKYFCERRLPFYEKRREYWLNTWKIQSEKEQNKKKFIELVLSKKLNLKQDDKTLYSDMEKCGLKKFKDEKAKKGYEYLLHMQIQSMTKKRIEALENEIEKLSEKVKDYEDNDGKVLWKRDLKIFKNAYQKFLKS